MDRPSGNRTDQASAGTDYRLSHQAPGKGRVYDALFRANPHRSMIWRLEQRALRRIASDLKRRGAVRHLDFACGTGRILACLEDIVDRSTGIDISQEMLATARGQVRTAELIHGDLTAENLLDGKQFDLITAFRFFPNAEPELRSAAMAAVVRHLAPDGRLVFNNHRHAGGSLYRLGAHTGGLSFTGVPEREMRNMAEAVGLAIERIYGIGLFPLSERRLQWLVRFIAPIEAAAAAANTGVLRPWCQDQVYVCRRAVQ
ncbi:MAG: methyltransferase domain-containing protein [Chthonomonadales bacterium]|nr:methyltransferase domain-containing protein [Chthonomonadales bacterium]